MLVVCHEYITCWRCTTTFSSSIESGMFHVVTVLCVSVASSCLVSITLAPPDLGPAKLSADVNKPCMSSFLHTFFADLPKRLPGRKASSQSADPAKDRCAAEADPDSLVQSIGLSRGESFAYEPNAREATRELCSHECPCPFRPLLWQRRAHQSNPSRPDFRTSADVRRIHWEPRGVHGR
jgi:hypothetical protein